MGSQVRTMSYNTLVTEIYTLLTKNLTSFDGAYQIDSPLTEDTNLGFGIQGTELTRRIIHYSFGIILILVGVAGGFGNGLVIYVFTRYRRLRGGGGRLVLSLATGDFLVSILHFMPAYSSFQEEWAFGHLGCELYASIVGLGGMASLITLSVIAADRFSVIMGSPYPWMSGKKMCLAVWFFCFFLVLPPFVGWSRYRKEGLETSCSWDYNTRTFNNRSYYIFLLFFGFVVPVTVITVSYVGILCVVCKHSTKMNGVTRNGIIHNKKQPTKSDLRTAQVIFTIIICFLVSWTPYAVVSLIGQFGDSSWLTPLNTALPAIFAKASVIYNPIVYGLSHPHFRSVIRAMRARRFPGNTYNNSQHENHHYQFRRKHYVRRTPLFRSGGNENVSVSQSRKSREGGIFRQPTSDPGTTLRTYESTRSASEEVRVNRNGWILLRKTAFNGDCDSDATGKSFIGTDDFSSYNMDLDVESNSTYSEPDLLRCDDRVVKMSENMSMVQYRRHKRDFLRKSLFRSENCLDNLNWKDARAPSVASGSSKASDLLVYYDPSRHHYRGGLKTSVAKKRSNCSHKPQQSNTSSPQRNGKFRVIGLHSSRSYQSPSSTDNGPCSSQNVSLSDTAGIAISTSVRVKEVPTASIATRKNYSMGTKSKALTGLNLYNEWDKRAGKIHDKVPARLNGRNKLHRDAVIFGRVSSMRRNFVSSGILSIRKLGRQDSHVLQRKGGLRRKSRTDSISAGDSRHYSASNPRLCDSLQDTSDSRSYVQYQKEKPAIPEQPVFVEILQSVDEDNASEFLDPMTDLLNDCSESGPRKHMPQDPKRLSAVLHDELSTNGGDSETFYSCD